MTSPPSTPTQRPRWILWMLVAGAFVALGAAYLYGPGDSDNNSNGNAGEEATRTSLPATDGTSLTSEPHRNTPEGSTGGPGAPPSEEPTVSAAPTVSVAPGPPAPPPTSASPTSAPSTAPPTTRPTTTAPVTTAPAPPPPPPALVVVTSCRQDDGRLLATGTVENRGASPHTFRVHAFVQDQGGETLIDITTRVPQVAPGRTVTFEIDHPDDADTLAQAASCKRAGAADAL